MPLARRLRGTGLKKQKNMYYITISNGLLEGDHQEKMGSSVWQFMWCIDKVTSIDEDGIGKVLGGKPINLTDIHGCSERTNSRNLNKLEQLGYIKLIHTPYGISIRVNKAKKVFQKREDKNGVPKRSDNIGVPLTKFGVPNKIIQLDNTAKIESEQSSQELPQKEKFSKLCFPVLKAFEEVDPKNKTYSKNKTQLSAANFLVKEYGLDTVLRVIGILPKTNRIQYAPEITNPHELKERWVKLEDFIKKEKAGKVTGNVIW
jgi:hypothetical protein